MSSSSSRETSSSEPYSSSSSSSSSRSAARRLDASFFFAMSASACARDDLPLASSSVFLRTSEGLNFFLPPASRSFFSRAIWMMRLRSWILARASLRSAKISSRSSSVMPARRARSSSSPMRSSPKPSPWGSLGSSASSSSCWSWDDAGGGLRVVSVVRSHGEARVGGLRSARS